MIISLLCFMKFRSSCLLISSSVKLVLCLYLWKVWMKFISGCFLKSRISPVIIWSMILAPRCDSFSVLLNPLIAIRYSINWIKQSEKMLTLSWLKRASTENISGKRSFGSKSLKDFYLLSRSRRIGTFIELSYSLWNVGI